MEPTHFRAEQTPTLIDLVFTNEEAMIKNLSHNPPLGKSHHHVLTFDYVCYTRRKDTNDEMKYIYSKGNYSEMRTELAAENLEEKLDALSTQEAWDMFSEVIKRLTKKYVPTVKTGKKSKKPLWLCEKTMAKVKKKNKMFKRYMETREGRDYAEYAKARNQARKACRQSIKNYERDIAKLAKTNPKAFYAYTSSKLKTREGVADLENEDGTFVTVDMDKATKLNNFFCSVFTQEDTSCIPTCESKQCISPLKDIDIEVEVVKKLLKTLDESKSQGPDELHPKILKEMAEELAGPMSCVFRKSINEGVVPRQWKQANVTPIFKKGKKQRKENYRPVSLTSIACKVMEKIIRDRIIQHLLTNEVLTNCQHGFVPGRSCVTNLLGVLDDWTSYLDQNAPVDAIYLDFAKAFDTVPHERLIKKLEACGISGRVSEWVKQFLLDRKQRVKVNSALSEWANVDSGVPQGSVLGPVLFVIFINDLPSAVDSLCSMYADDTKIYSKACHEEDCLKLQKDLDNLVEWSERWQMKFNEAKCKVLQLGKTNRKFEYSMKKHNNQNRTPLQSSMCEKDLGVLVDCDLDLSKHIEAQVNKANRILGLIRRSFEYMDKDIMKLMFCALVRPHLEYACSVWSPRYEKDRTLIEQVLRRATKCVPGLSNLAYEDRLKVMKIPSMSYRRIRGDLIEMYKFTHGLYDCKMPFDFSTDSRTRGHMYKLKKQRCDTSLRQNFFSNRVFTTWNSLDATVVEAPTVNAFKNRLDKLFKDFEYDSTANHPIEIKGTTLQ
jgi:hypothetical protein